MKNTRKWKMIWLILAISFLPLIGALYLMFKPQNLSSNKKQMTNFVIKPLDFKNWWFIPANFTCDGANQFPRFEIETLPENTQTFVIRVEDPDAPMVRPFVHLLAVNVPAVKIIDENILAKATLGMNDFMQIGWGWPCPPEWHWVHHYQFKFFALNTGLDLKTGFNLQQFAKALTENEENIIWRAEIIGLYSK